MEQNKLRVFIAIELDEPIRSAIKDLQHKLKVINADVSWVKTDNIHLTLKFIGNVLPSSVPELCQAIKAAIQGFPCFEFRIGPCGWFSQGSDPRILWLGISQGSDQLIKIATALANHVSAFGSEKQDKLFSPHITIGRARSRKNIIQLYAKIKTLDLQLDNLQRVNKILLIKSDLSSSGAKYSFIEEFRLSNI